MTLKNKSVTLTLLTLISVVLTVSFIAIDKKKIAIEKEDLIQYLMSMDLGFSSRYNLVDSGQEEFHSGVTNLFSEYRKLILPSFIKSLPEILKYKLSLSNFERIDIDIKYQDYQKIEFDRGRALKDTILSNATTVNAKLRYKGREHKVKIRLKGDLPDHWFSKYRMSLRVELNNKKTDK